MARFLFDMTSEEVKELDPKSTCIIFSISPIEEHGPHLPLATDIIEAEGMVDRLVPVLQTGLPGWTFLRYPPIPLGVDGFEYPGTASVEPETMKRVVKEVVMSFHRHGFERFIISSHHGSPRHNLAIDEAARECSKNGAKVLALATKIIVELYLKGGLQRFFQYARIPSDKRDALELDCHAGAFETAEVMLFRPDLVRDVFKQLPPVLVPIERLTKLSAQLEGDGLGYFGAPAWATHELGEKYIDFVMEMVADDTIHFVKTGHAIDLEMHWRLLLRTLSSVSRVRERFDAWRHTTESKNGTRNFGRTF